MTDKMQWVRFVFIMLTVPFLLVGYACCCAYQNFKLGWELARI